MEIPKKVQITGWCSLTCLTCHSHVYPGMCEGDLKVLWRCAEDLGPVRRNTFQRQSQVTALGKPSRSSGFPVGTVCRNIIMYVIRSLLSRPVVLKIERPCWISVSWCVENGPGVQEGEQHQGQARSYQKRYIIKGSITCNYRLIRRDGRLLQYELPDIEQPGLPSGAKP